MRRDYEAGLWVGRVKQVEEVEEIPGGHCSYRPQRSNVERVYR